jgi:hypothetical protein
MTGRPLPLLLPTLRTWRILHRCYRGQDPSAVLEGALIMRATADGHLDPRGQIKTGAGGRPAGRRP